MGFTLEAAAPSLADEEIATRPQAKSEALAVHFAGKMAAPAGRMGGMRGAAP